MSRRAKPPLTILMPVYNAGSFLSGAVESVLSQTFKEFEFLIINDGSTDDSLKTLQKYAKKDKRIRLISRKNKGFVKTLEEGMKKASADIIARVDADDVCLPERLEKQYSFLADNPEYSIVACQLRGIDEKDELKEIDPRPLSDHGLKLFLGYGCALSNPTTMFKKNVVLEAGGFLPEDYPADDYGCWARIVIRDRAAKMYTLPEVLYLYRENTQGISLTNKVKQITKTIEIGNAFRSSMLQNNWKFLTYTAHKEWFNDAAQLPDAAARENLKRIYYTVQTWFIADQAKLSPFRARLNSLRLRLYTRLFNKQDKKYLDNVLPTHTFPEGNAS